MEENYCTCFCLSLVLKTDIPDEPCVDDEPDRPSRTRDFHVFRIFAEAEGE